MVDRTASTIFWQTAVLRKQLDTGWKRIREGTEMDEGRINSRREKRDCTKRIV